MKKLEIMKTLKLSFGKASFAIQKNAPEILVVTGIIGVGATVVTACVATTKLSKITEESKKQLDDIRAYVVKPDKKEDYTEEDGRKDLTIVYAQTAIKIAALYLPSVALGFVSVGCIVQSNNILRKRNMALAAAYATIDKGFKEYRARVIDRFGEQVDHELKYNLSSMEVTTIDENGVSETKTITTASDSENEFVRVYDSRNKGYRKDTNYNRMKLRAQQEFANKVLWERGYLFLNEVYELLDMEPTKAGAICGWVYDIKNPTGDNSVDFRIKEIDEPVIDNFGEQLGFERAYVLDFNVDGPILNKVYK